MSPIAAWFPSVGLRALQVIAVLGLAFAAGACAEAEITPPDAETIRKLTITVRPGAPTIAPVDGYTDFGLAAPRDGHVYVPSSYDPATAAPLLVLLHGAGGNRSAWMTPFIETQAEANALVIVAIDSRYPTWDVVQTGFYEEDVAFLEDALEFVFARVNVDPTRVFIGGFSDGAIEALGIGVANAGLFSRIMAFSPGALILPFSRGYPSVFVSMGDADPRFLNARDVIVPRLRNNGMVTEFVSFAGGHELPEEILLTGFTWLMLEEP